MPKLKVKGKVKKFPYTAAGIAEAKSEAKSGGMLVMNRKKSKNTYGIKDLKV